MSYFEYDSRLYRKPTDAARRNELRASARQRIIDTQHRYAFSDREMGPVLGVSHQRVQHMRKYPGRMRHLNTLKTYLQRLDNWEEKIEKGEIPKPMTVTESRELLLDLPGIMANAVIYDASGKTHPKPVPETELLKQVHVRGIDPDRMLYGLYNPELITDREAVTIAGKVIGWAEINPNYKED